MPIGIAVCAVLLFGSACGDPPRNGSLVDQAERHRVRHSKSYPDLSGLAFSTDLRRTSSGHPASGDDVRQQPLRKTIRRFASLMFAKDWRDSRGPADSESSLSSTSAWKRPLLRLKSKLRRRPSRSTLLESRDQSGPASASSDEHRLEPVPSRRVHPYGDPFLDDVPHVVRVLINTIYGGTDMSPTSVQGVFRVAPALKGVDDAMAELAKYHTEMPDADKQNTKRAAAFYMKRWLREQAERGYPLLPDSAVQIVMHGNSVLHVMDMLCAGRRHTLYELRDLLRWLVRVQLPLPAGESITLDSLAMLLAPSLMNQYFLGLDDGIPYRIGFLPIFQRWLLSSS
ncbi:unnamed protein product (mitochondrion) [Plasmodiophora brassicae]|uniref:Rho-GAP domain-containing protein n=1 Tax=Plasmodiophora brassicae TaxID=37360 RepID=A0A0G4J908_PLABS|nr:hypothetical protein PBRA_003428 [Plasmodiophora brassicae]SPQ99776.1 unnamed protein product [Plasmodiophora brassicae]